MNGPVGTVTYSGAKLDRQIVQTSQFAHVVFANRAARTAAAGPVWVFLDGDGNAWLRDGRTAEDPTPSNPLALQLLLHAPGPAIYLARPCTFGTVTSDPHCNPGVWTVGRYAGPVVQSLVEAIQADRSTEGPIVLVGYSGGGVLAMQLAQRLGNVIGVITIAANLDVAGWARRHGYADAVADPAAELQTPLPAAVVQLHVFGGRDLNAPYGLAAERLARDPRARIRVFDAADHDCCWVELWPAIAHDFQQLMEASTLLRSSSSLR